MIPYVERKNTHKVMMNKLLASNIKAVTIMAQNMLNPVDYNEFERIMKALKRGYKR